MTKNGSSKASTSGQSLDGITRVTVGGFKSLAEEQSIEIRPLTVLAGANSSGKSSIMQPLLLLKQTLEASYDPGALLLDGAHLRFTSVDQLFSHTGVTKKEDTFSVGFEVDKEVEITTFFKRRQTKGIDVARMHFETDKHEFELSVDTENPDIEKVLGDLNSIFGDEKKVVIRDRCFLDIIPKTKKPKLNSYIHLLLYKIANKSMIDIYDILLSILHLPGLRGNPARTYPVTAVGPKYPGTFEIYTASVINHWEEAKHSDELKQLTRDLRTLGLTWKVTARRINDTQVELQVGRLSTPAKGGARDLVSIADVGFGVSQTLPVLVALHTASPGQLVYVEQPELHLHPRAQRAMAEVLANAAKRGVRVVAETHSDLLIRGIQTEVARGNLSPKLVKHHWFERQKDGTTEVTSADLDEAGTFGEWPEDFAEVYLDAEGDFLDASLKSPENR